MKRPSAFEQAVFFVGKEGDGQMENVTLIGMPGSGKSTVGVVLAKTLGFSFLDVDLVIQERQGKLLQTLLNELGTEKFLDLEGATIRSLSPKSTVLAPGGSCVLRQDAMEHLKSLGKVVYLRLDLPALEGRIHNLTTRGIAFGPGQTLRDVYAQRAPLYARYADVTVDADGQTLERTLAAVQAALGR